MKYDTIEKWLNSESCGSYDFVEDTQRNSDQFHDYGQLEKKDAYVKFFIYKFNTSSSKPDWNILQRVEDKELKEKFLENRAKFLKMAEKYNDINDPDESSVLLQAVYQNLWPDLMKKVFMTYEAKTPQKKETVTSMYSDTMTSAMTRFTDAMKQLISDKIMEDYADSYSEVVKKIICIYNACNSGQHWWSTNFSILVIACLDEDDRKELYQLIAKYYPCMPCYLNACHRVGNYCPVPAGFNSARSGNFAVYDYWDLTLMKIREWYLAVDKLSMYERDQILSRDLLHNQGNALNCMRWLECFGQGEIGWRNFVDTLFMQDYVNEETYKVIPFWTKHGWKQDADSEKAEFIGFPDALKDKEMKEEIKNGLMEICRRINARSARIMEACRKAVALKNDLNLYS